MAHGFASRAVSGTPLPHASTHQSGGSDAIKLDDLAAPDDNTDLNASTSAHGLLNKLDNTATNFLDGTGAWDSVKDSDLSVSDITTNNVSTSAHGFAPKVSGSDGDVLTKSGSAAVWSTPSSGGGKLLQRTYTEYSSSTGLTATIPKDDTIPQSGEGTEVFSQSITPTNSSNRIRITAAGWLTINGTRNAMLALFKDSGADAIAVADTTIPTANYIYPFLLIHEQAAGSTSAQTFKLRAGPSGDTLYFNGDAGGRLFGGASHAVFIIEELTP